MASRRRGFLVPRRRPAVLRRAHAEPRRERARSGCRRALISSQARARRQRRSSFGRPLTCRNLRTQRF
eukprot:1499639-Alexandrium_andersonii.AAC.1